MQNNTFSVEGLFDFLNAGVSAFHSTAAAVKILEENGYQNCPESAAWELVPGGRYYTTRNGSAVLAWRMPKGELTGWHVTASHSDSPTWRIKQLDGGKDAVFAKAETEGYGGMIMPTWLDRPLSVAGRILVRTENGIRSLLRGVPLRQGHRRLHQLPVLPRGVRGVLECTDHRRGSAGARL